MKQYLFLFLFPSTICLGQGYKPIDLLQINFDSITGLYQKNNLYFSNSIKSLPKEVAFALADSLFDQLIASSWGSYTTYCNAETLIVIFDNVEKKHLQNDDKKNFG